MPLTFRPATMKDEGRLLVWRNDPRTCEMSRNMEPVKYDNHHAWLTRSLESDSRALFICERDGQPIGTIRVDYGDGLPELSWTLAGPLRGQGLGKRMVADFIIAQNAGNYRCEVKIENTPSLVIAKSLGLELTVLD